MCLMIGSQASKQKERKESNAVRTEIEMNYHGSSHTHTCKLKQADVFFFQLKSHVFFCSDTPTGIRAIKTAPLVIESQWF